MTESDANAKIRSTIGYGLRLVSHVCSDEYALEEARNLVPIAELVQENLEVLEGDFQDNLLPILVQWFKSRFFKWFSPPNCEKCQDELTFESRCSNIEKKPVENYGCRNKNCDYQFQFIRHDDPAILLTTRTGRCGEWANCFLLILRALGYDSRLVIDTTDHVWNEIWSSSQERWIHVDSCEATVDKPLLYEVGWGKKLEYCLAFSEFEVLDVTRRYTLDYGITKQRRNSCSEEWLESYLSYLTNDLLGKAAPDLRKTVLERRRKDLEYMKQKASSPRTVESFEQLSKRQTGSEEWRRQRGE